MKNISITLWGCGRIGTSIAQILHENGFLISFFVDKNNELSKNLSNILNMGSDISIDQIFDNHPKMNIVIDTTGDIELLDYWKNGLNNKLFDYVIVTRREPKADLQVMSGVFNTTPVPLKGGITSFGSCTGNCLVPFLSHLSRNVSIDSVSCRVLHPLKQDKIIDLRSIKTALNDSLNDFEPEIASYTIAQAMELPVDRGMALDVSISFSHQIERNILKNHFEKMAETMGIFTLSEAQCSASSIIDNPHSSVLDPGWTLINNNFRGLLWQDNEKGFSYRILDLIDNMEF